jgi:hypothetical protein
MYLPNDDTIGTPLVSNIPNQPYSQILSYGVNAQYGRGPIKGTFGYYVYPVSANFNPPADCAVQGGAKASSPMPCEPYAGADKDMPAYLYRQYLPASITNTTIKQPINMYVRRGDVVILISTSDTDPAELYAKVKNMHQVKPADLPADTLVSFEPAH